MNLKSSPIHLLANTKLQYIDAINPRPEIVQFAAPPLRPISHTVHRIAPTSCSSTINCCGCTVAALSANGYKSHPPKSLRRWVDSGKERVRKLKGERQKAMTNFGHHAKSKRHQHSVQEQPHTVRPGVCLLHTYTGVYGEQLGLFKPVKTPFSLERVLRTNGDQKSTVNQLIKHMLM